MIASSRRCPSGSTPAICWYSTIPGNSGTLQGCKASGGKVELLVERLLEDGQVLAQSAPAGLPQWAVNCIWPERVRRRCWAVRGSCSSPVYGRSAGARALATVWSGALAALYHPTCQGCRYERYQTVYARHPGAVAAPTAGLHFDQSLLTTLRTQGIEQALSRCMWGRAPFSRCGPPDYRTHHACRTGRGECGRL